ncbi:MAG: hypothetical protein P8Y23_01725 [Candidatus Lokiarchaeota archaeon]|jgi:hypothetical protein
MGKNKIKLWTIGQIDATGVRGPHEIELQNISKNKYPLFINLNTNMFEKLINKELGANVQDLGMDEDWTVSIELFPKVIIHIAYTFYGDEFGDEIEAELKFYFSGDRSYWVPGEDTATYIDIVMNFIERLLKDKEPFEKNYSEKTDLMEKVLIQRSKPFKYLKNTDKDRLSEFIGAKVWQTETGWRIKKEFFPQMFAEIIWSRDQGLDIEFSGDNLKNMSSYHAELIGIFIINHILRYITLHNEDKPLPDICHIMFSRMFTKEKGWEHRTR